MYVLAYCTMGVDKNYFVEEIDSGRAGRAFAPSSKMAHNLSSSSLPLLCTMTHHSQAT